MLEQTLAASPYLAGPELTCADIMVNYCVTSTRMFGGRDDSPMCDPMSRRKQAARLHQAMQIAGPRPYA